MKLRDGLTILIPTYNRKERLLNTLHSISSQGRWGDYFIIIVDNCSDYDVEETIKMEFPSEFSHNIVVYRWFFNTGMSTNISIAFEFVRTKWCWFISDDDEILNGALNIVLEDTHRFPDFVAVKYSIVGICEYDDTTIHNVDEWSNYYLSHSSGDKGYLSMLYNVSLIYTYLSELTVHSYTYLSFWLPVIRALNEKNVSMMMSSDALYRYKNNNDGWSSSAEKYLITLLGIRTLFDSNYGLSSKSFYVFKKVFADLFDAKSVVRRIVSLPEREKRAHYYKLLNLYLSGRLTNVLLSKFLYYFVMLFNLSPSLIEKTLRIRDIMK